MPVLSSKAIMEMVDARYIPLWITKTDLLETIKDREDAICELNKRNIRIIKQRDNFEKQTTLLIEGLERITKTLHYAPDIGLYNASEMRKIALETLAKIKE